MEKNSIRIIVEGHVQGVGFRFFTHQKAVQLNLTGYVRNLINGNVEIIACGTKNQLELFEKWLNEGGPRSAHIAHFTISEHKPAESFKTFNVRS